MSAPVPRLDLRSMILFLHDMERSDRDTDLLLTEVLARDTRFMHETGHWARYHGSASGVLLTLLRRRRDIIAAETLSGLHPDQRRQMADDRLTGKPFAAQAPADLAARYGKQTADRMAAWHEMFDAYQILLDAETVSGRLPHPARTLASAVVRLRSRYRETLMLTPTPGVRLDDAPPVVDLPAGAQLTTRLLLECASVIDESAVAVFGRAFQADTDAGHAWMAQHRMAGKYGAPYLLACQAAGRDGQDARRLHPLTVQALIDFALNPVVPGLHPDEEQLNWPEFYPPVRFMLAAQGLRGHDEPSLSLTPTSAETRECQRYLSRLSGLRFGEVDIVDFWPATTPRDAVNSTDAWPEKFYAAILNATDDMQRVRLESPQRIAYYYSNFVFKTPSETGDAVLRERIGAGETFIGDRVLLRSIDGQLVYQVDRLGEDAATALLIATYVAGSFDDVLTDTADSVDCEHLPRAELADADFRDFLGQKVEFYTGLALTPA